MKKLYVVFLLVGVVSLFPLVAQAKLKSGNGYLFARVQSTSTGWSLSLCETKALENLYRITNIGRTIYRVPTNQTLVVFELPEGEYTFFYSISHRYHRERIFKTAPVRVVAGEIVYAGDILLEPIYNAPTQPDLNYRVQENFLEALEDFKRQQSKLAELYPVTNGVAKEDEVYLRALPFDPLAYLHITSLSQFLEGPGKYMSTDPAVQVSKEFLASINRGLFRMTLDLGELTHGFFIHDSGVYVPLEFQYQFSEYFALMSGVTLISRQRRPFDLGLSLGIRYYSLPPDISSNFGLFLGVYPLWNISPFDCIESGHFVWNTMFEVGNTRVLSKHLFVDTSLGWVLRDIPYNLWFFGGVAISFKFGFAF